MYKLFAKTILIFTSPAVFAAGPIIIGVRGGVPLNDVINTVNSGSGVSSATKNYVVGPTLGVNLPAGFSVAADALYSRLKINISRPSLGGVSASANSWEFPVLLRFTAGRQAIAPFVGAGFSVRHLGDFGEIGRFTGITGGGNTVVTTTDTVGFVIGGGLRFKAGALNISPELRYTRWGSENIGDAFRQVLKTNRNEGRFLVGLTF